MPEPTVTATVNEIRPASSGPTFNVGADIDTYAKFTIDVTGDPATTFKVISELEHDLGSTIALDSDAGDVTSAVTFTRENNVSQSNVQAGWRYIEGRVFYQKKFGPGNYGPTKLAAIDRHWIKVGSPDNRPWGRVTGLSPCSIQLPRAQFEALSQVQYSVLGDPSGKKFVFEAEFEVRDPNDDLKTGFLLQGDIVSGGGSGVKNKGIVYAVGSAVAGVWTVKCTIHAKEQGVVDPPDILLDERTCTFEVMGGS